jgi:hypothetical protein
LLSLFLPFSTPFAHEDSVFCWESQMDEIVELAGLVVTACVSPDEKLVDEQAERPATEAPNQVSHRRKTQECFSLQEPLDVSIPFATNCCGTNLLVSSNLDKIPHYQSQQKHDLRVKYFYSPIKCLE